MGRKPNPLIVEYFKRGAKIADASNRYEHTCKLCGEQFPKGRIDSLTAHLTKKCIGLTMSDRTKIVLRLHDLADPTAAPEVNNGTKDGTQIEAGNTLDLPFSPTKQQNFNALNVLAEASRRVGGDGPVASGYTSAEQVHLHDHAQPLPLDPQLEIDSFAQHLLESPDDGLGPRNNGFPASSTASLPPLFSFMASGPPVSQDELGLSLVSTIPPDLSTIAASANETLANGVMVTDLDVSQDGVPGVLLDDLHGHSFSHDRTTFHWTNAPAPIHISQNEMPVQPAAESVQEPDEHPSQPLRPIAMNPHSRQTNFVSESGTPNKVQKHKVRGRFAPDRRKEVRELRKVGACMRCRMLKKVCSQETPCQTCAAVEAPRLWKNSCVRAKLVETYTLFFIGLHAAIAYRETNQVKSRSNVATLEGNIEASHFNEQSIVFKGFQNTQTGLLIDGTPDLTSSQTVITIDLEPALDVLPKIEQYLHSISTQVIEQESCPVMKTSLTQAMAIKSNEHGQLTNDKQDKLLSDIIELWTATVILSDSSLTWDLFQTNDMNFERQPLQHDNGSYFLIVCQLRAAVEKRASLVCKAAMHHFEQRVLSRHKSNNFETFLAAFILLNCAERMCWLFQTWEVELPDRPAWPFDLSARSYVEKGQHLANTIEMMLELRQLGPKVNIDLQSGNLIPRNKDDTTTIAWLAGAGLTKDILLKKESAQFDPSDSRSLDGTFWARLLLT
ncbi:uncharacterized protein A1O9_07761 [Exophiala aquamarina CBS 119918]|uniref:Uncharacterized protein n=1 Tax=Exophiala aquamarina CBS 119918 TaxID=1182545 RepID=A0A072PKZ5_9EURO|nr:uncharacterized protein A1O9_07761 [Exophiala aquamarina CBS 119918]KEF56180.1 hypothetical protein A1O9_07761 [Exophiala aquamarina CBS 119918]